MQHPTYICSYFSDMSRPKTTCLVQMPSHHHGSVRLQVNITLNVDDGREDDLLVKWSAGMADESKEVETYRASLIELVEVVSKEALGRRPGEYRTVENDRIIKDFTLSQTQPEFEEERVRSVSDQMRKMSDVRTGKQSVLIIENVYAVRPLPKISGIALCTPRSHPKISSMIRKSSYAGKRTRAIGRREMIRLKSYMSSSESYDGEGPEPISSEPYAEPDLRVLARAAYGSGSGESPR